VDVDVTTVEVNVTEVVEVSQLQASVVEVDVVHSAGTYEVVSENTVVVESTPLVQFIEVEVGIPGPPGPPGPAAGETMPYAKRTDFVGDDVIYKGEAEPGSDELDPVWRISKITFVGEDATEQWAGGTANFVHVWTNRTSLTYI
jgi:hypothetical protein